MSDREDVLERVRKLLALANEESGAGEHERDNAAERAQVLMVKNRIEEHELEKERESAIEDVRVGPMPEWKGELLGEIGRNGAGVDAVFDRNSDPRIWFLVGRPEDIAYVQMLHSWLVPQLEAECEIGLNIIRSRPDLRSWDQWVEPRDSIEFRESFFHGAVGAIAARLRAANREAEAESTTGTDLVRSDRAALDEFYGDKKPTKSPPRVVRGPAADLGWSTGQAADINPGNKVEQPTGSGELGPG